MGIIKSKETKIKHVADIVFCIDCSFSMIPVIDSIKDNIVALINGLDELKVIDWRARVVGFHDFRDYIAYDNPFVSSQNWLKSQLDDIKAKGCVENGPAPVFETISYVVNNSEWRECCRKIIIFLTDTIAKQINDLDIKVFSEELMGMHINLLLYGKGDLSYHKMCAIPRSDIMQFDDPIEFYYHKTIEWSRFFYCFLDTTEAELDDIL